MHESIRRSATCACLGITMLAAAPAQAQNWSFDAREVALGGVGSTSNVAYDMVSEQKSYRAIVLPFGLFQVIPNFPKMNPTSDEFDLARAIEYSVSPIHYIVGRDTSESGGQFLNDLRNGELSRDLNDLWRLHASDEHLRRGPGVAELGRNAQIPGKRQCVSRGLHRRRPLPLDADVGHA